MAVGDTELTLLGPRTVLLATDVEYTGMLSGVDESLRWVPLPNRKLKFFIDGIVITTAITDADGRYAAVLQFGSPGMHTLVVKYFAAGVSGLPPPDEWCTRDGDTVFRSGCQESWDVNVFICQGGAWRPTNLPCTKDVEQVEPCECYDGDNEWHPCASGDSQGYVARFECVKDQWTYRDGVYCQPSETPPGVCSVGDTWWKVCGDVTIPEYWCNGSRTVVPTNFPCPRPTPYHEMKEFTFAPPSTSIRLDRMHITRHENTLVFGATGIYPLLLHYVFLVNKVTKAVQTVTFARQSTTNETIAGLAIVGNEIWALLSSVYPIDGVNYIVKLVKLDFAGNVIAAYVFGDGYCRPQGVIKLASGAAVAYFYSANIGSFRDHKDLGFVYIAPGVEPTVLWPVRTMVASGSGTTVTMEQHPVDGNIWAFWHDDTIHAGSAVRLQEVAGAISLVASYPDLLVGCFQPYGEIPPFKAYKNMARGTITIVTAAFPDSTCSPGRNYIVVRGDDGIGVDQRQVLVADISAFGAVSPYISTYPEISGVSPGRDLAFQFRADGTGMLFHNRIVKESSRRLYLEVMDEAGLWTEPVLLGQPNLVSDPYLPGNASDHEYVVYFFATDGRVHLFSELL